MTETTKPTHPPINEENQGDEITVWEITPTHPKGFGGHVFNYESSTDLFKCEHCGRYEISVRDDSGEIQPCAPR